MKRHPQRPLVFSFFAAAVALSASQAMACDKPQLNV